MSSYPFQDIYAIARGDMPNTTNVPEKDIEMIIAHLKREIQGQILNNITVGLDSPPGPVTNRRSLNHTMKLFPLVGGGQARLSMENRLETKLGKVGRGVLIVKFTNYQGATMGTTTMETALPWNKDEGIRTLQDYVKMVGEYKLDEYEMTAAHKGCRFHAKGLLDLEIDAYMTDLTAKNEALQWTSFSTTPGLQDEKLKEEIARESKRRSELYFEKYFNLSGQAREVAKEEGKFINDIPKPQAMRAWAQELKFEESNPMDKLLEKVRK